MRALVADAAGSLGSNLGSAHRHNGRDRGSCWWSQLSWGARYAPASLETALSQSPRRPAVCSNRTFSGGWMRYRALRDY
jgi:hypothetical protein